MARRGEQLIAEAAELVISALRANADGLTNSEVDDATGLNLPISRRRGYVTWTILQHLVEQGRVRKEGRLYKIAR
jgi:hypothetical protein